MKLHSESPMRKGSKNGSTPEFQARIVERIDQEARRAGIPVQTGPQGFARLAIVMDEIISYNPANGEELGRVKLASAEDYDRIADNSLRVFERWRMLPAPSAAKSSAKSATLCAKRKTSWAGWSRRDGQYPGRGRGEVQEMIDVADFAVGLSRQLYGLTMASERPGHRLYEQWHPLGPVGVISAFNFPVAVWSWNALIAMVCGDTVIWKPSLKTPLTAVAVTKSAAKFSSRHGWEGVLSLVIGRDDVVGERMIRDRRLPLISATGSTRWAGMWARWSPSGWAARCSNWAGITA